MIPVQQRVIDAIQGDCFAACVASILELPEAPNFKTDSTGSWLNKWNAWLEPRGLYLYGSPAGAFPAPAGYAIMAIKSVNFPGSGHSVVWKGDFNDGYSGKVVHDPSPLKHPDDYEPIFWYVFAVPDPVSIPWRSPAAPCNPG